MKNVRPMLHVPDVAATARWYESIGFDVLDLGKEDGDRGEVIWALVAFGEGQVMFSAGGRKSDARRREVDLYVDVDDVEAAFAQVKDRVDLVEGLHDTFYGTREFLFRDVNRFWITFGQRRRRPAP